MLTWKVWADEDLLFEGSEEAARQYIVEHPADASDVVLESPDGDSYAYKDGTWVLQGTAGFWGPNGVSQGPLKLFLTAFRSGRETEKLP